MLLEVRRELLAYARLDVLAETLETIVSMHETHCSVTKTQHARQTVGLLKDMQTLNRCGNSCDVGVLRSYKQVKTTARMSKCSQ